ncbi:golgin subfamily A member 6-like protein 6 [Astatotilapia calliptera]|uniref:golgin subfamily A member 6-like protein 6 n=1 Tax=Astatotilapia calliptera TaxID=8154 RepID=UPI000E4298D9|nr:golgin subfamily A member 6-like protein 6 [Astatotilapia calliptera]
MSREIVNNSQSDRAIPAESIELCGLVEREISEPRDLQMKIQELQLELSTLKREKKYYKKNYYRFKNEREQMSTDVHDRNVHFRESMVELEEVTQQSDNIQALIVAENKNLQAEVRTFRMMLHEFQEKEASLLEQNSNIVAELSQIERERNEQKKENAHLKEALVRLEHQVGEAHHKISKKEEIIEKQNREIDHKTEQIVELKKEICTLQRRVRQALDDKQSQVESLEAKLQEQVKAVQMMHCDFQEKEEYLLKENSSIAAEINKLKTANTNLKKRLQNLEYQEKTTESLTLQIFWLKEKVKEQNFKIVHNEDLIDELYEHLKMKREIINNLQDELRREEEEEILAAVHNITGEPLQLENLAPEPEELFFPALEPPPDVVPTQENLGLQPEELDCPVSEPSPDVAPTSGSWRHGAKRLLKIGLGVAAVGLIIPAAYWGFSMLNSDCLFNSVYGLLEPYCHLGDGLGPF